ncbi:Major Facilitator Superfamily domain containing protein [Elaphomyces granulatus]
MEKELQPETGVPVDTSTPTKDISLSSNENGSSHDSTTDVAPPAPAAEETSPESSRSSLHTIVIMCSLCAALFLAALDITIVTTALPTITHYFQSDSGYTWIGSAYLLTAAAFTPSWGKLSDIWGRKPILLIAAGVFFIGSTLAATSVSISMLIAARAIQGIGGGGLVVLVNICVSDLFSMRNRGKYLGFIAVVWAVASALGPILGGVFAEKVSWRWCFYINLPITGTVFILLWMLLKLDNPKTPVWDGLKAVDWVGSITMIGGTLMILLGLDFGGVSYPWSSATVICLIIFGVVVIALFIVNEWRFAKYPVIPLRIFKHSSNIAALGVCFCHGFVFIAGSYYLPLYFQSVIGAGPLLSGAYLLPYIVSFSFVSYATGILIKRSGKYLPTVWLGLAIMTLGFGLFIDLPLSATWSKIILYQIVAGIGVGQNFNSPLVALQTLVKPGDIATATATFFFTRILSTSISVVIGSVVFQNEMQKQQPSLIAALGPETANVLSGGSAAASVDVISQLPDGQRDVARAAFHHSLKIMWIVYVAFAGLGLAIGFFIGNQILSKDHTVTKTGLKEEEGKRQEELEKRKGVNNIEAGEVEGS